MTDTVLVDTTFLPGKFSDYHLDDVSLIPSNLPAYAGPDHYLIPGDSAFIGREPDVGIDEACRWYKLPNDSIPIDTIAGMYVKQAAGTSTYVVRQQLNCGGVKWDTVLVNANPVGLSKILANAHAFRIAPNPASTNVRLLFDDASLLREIKGAEIRNGLSQEIRSVSVSEAEDGIDIRSLDAGVYFLYLNLKDNTCAVRKFVIDR